jgi:hypothetical protein
MRDFERPRNYWRSWIDQQVNARENVRSAEEFDRMVSQIIVPRGTTAESLMKQYQLRARPFMHVQAQQQTIRALQVDAPRNGGLLSTDSDALMRWRLPLSADITRLQFLPNVSIAVIQSAFPAVTFLFEGAGVGLGEETMR